MTVQVTVATIAPTMFFFIEIPIYLLVMLYNYPANKKCNYSNNDWYYSEICYRHFRKMFLWQLK